MNIKLWVVDMLAMKVMLLQFKIDLLVCYKNIIIEYYHKLTCSYNFLTLLQWISFAFYRPF